MATEFTERTCTRGSTRFRAALQGDLLPESGPPLPLTTVNICTGGLLAHTPERVPPMTHVGLRLHLGEETFETQAVCLRATDASPFQEAFFFLDPDPRLRVHLVDYLCGNFESYA